MKICHLVEILLVCLSLFGCTKTREQEVLLARKSVFKIQVSSQEPKFTVPWQRTSSKESSGSGFYIGDGKILTNAHVVAYGKHIAVLRDGDPVARQANLLHIAHDCDLALLAIDDKAFLKDLVALKFGDLPKLLSPVSNIGYPTGGDQLSITNGVVSRISYRRYVHSGGRKHLLIQVDSALNPGNSGGPVMQGKKVVGVAFQSYSEAENTGYIIPVAVVQRFLKDITDNHYDGHPEDGLTLTEGATMNPSTIAYHGLNKSIGVKVADVAFYASTYQNILPSDIILAINDSQVGVDGRVEYEGERVEFNTIYDLAQIGDVVHFKIFRQGKVLDIPVKVEKSKPHYFAENIYTEFPRYSVVGGLVFSALSRSYLVTWGKKWYQSAPLLLRYLHFNGDYDDEFKMLPELIVLISRLPDPINSYVEEQIYGVLKAINGKPIYSLDEMEQTLADIKDGLIVFEFWNHLNSMVLPADDVKNSHQQILQKYGVNPEHWLGDTRG